jgi:uncharacterized protein involved in response to NO
MTSKQPAAATEIRPLWRLAFRAGFLGAALFAVLGMARWLYWMTRPQVWQGELPPNWWHAHEMIFGFALPVVAGFLLTAVATWTGTQGTRGRRLRLLFGLWLLARLVLWLAPGWMLLAWLAEMLFIALTMFELGIRVWPCRQWRNMLFLPVLLILALLDSASYRCVGDLSATTGLHYGAVWMVAALVVIVGGRVTPVFTANRLGLTIEPLPGWLEALAIGSVILVGLVRAVLPSLPGGNGLQLLCVATGLLHLYRLAHWQGWKTREVPLLWSMHLSYLCIPLALLGLALAGDDPIAGKNMMHLLAIGTVGGMILAMMCRVSLGHTGRPLEVPAYLAWAFAAIIAAAVIRSLLPWLAPQLTALAWRSSSVLWIFAFSCFLYHYLPVLTRPRTDGKPG